MLIVCSSSNESSKLQNISTEIEDQSNDADSFDFPMDESLVTTKIELEEETQQDGDPLSVKEEPTPNTDNKNTRTQVEVHEEDLFCDWIRTNLSTIPDPLLRMPLYCNIVKEIQKYMQTLKDNGKM